MYNQKNQDDATNVGGIPVVTGTKYLGTALTDKKDLFNIYRRTMITKAQIMGNITRDIFGRCNKLFARAPMGYC